MRARRRGFRPLTSADIAGLIMLAMSAAGFIALFAWAYTEDAKRGITPCESLAMWGMHVC